MPSRMDERVGFQHDHNRQRPARSAAEVRNSDIRAGQITTPRPAPHAGFDADLNPVDDELINTRGSER